MSAMAKKTFTVAQRWVPRVHRMTSREWPTAVALLPSSWEAKAAIGLLQSSATVLLSLLLWKGLGQGRGADLRLVGFAVAWFPLPAQWRKRLPLTMVDFTHQFDWAMGCP